ncbi:TadE family type IV pilus minor pilin [Cellulomonas sp. URHD0024]|uniref:TadE family type IV pilus minor pilin n=1 Tax=Cellulomonas sp. URHD0024 TaxID=1302620 RepID=UPI00042561E3|nr:TadE family type IV pilus minor pilin [Cellulomonas sp. URHD0024]
MSARDRGSVTAELAVGLPAVVLVLVALLAVSSAAITQARCSDGARAGARSAALGEDDAMVVATARRVAGADADVRVSRSDGWAGVTVTHTVGPWRGVPLRASATSVARDEP